MITSSNSRENAGLADIIAACCFNGVRFNSHAYTL